MTFCRPVPKEKTPRDEKYKAFIRQQRCLLNGGRYGLCFGDVQAHHSETGGTGLKGSDYSCLPLCFSHHGVMDNATKKGIGIWSPSHLRGIIKRLKEKYIRQGGKIKCR